MISIEEAMKKVSECISSDECKKCSLSKPVRFHLENGAVMVMCICGLILMLRDALRAKGKNASPFKTTDKMKEIRKEE